MSIANDDKFRVRKPSYQNWTSPKMTDVRSWNDMIKFISAMEPSKIHSYRIQVNWKREEEIESNALSENA